MNQTTNEAADRQDGSACVVEMTVRQQLDAFVAGMDARLEELRADVLKAESEVQTKKALCAALPENLPLSPASLRVAQAYRADAELIFDITSREQAVALTETLPGVELVMVQGGCTTFVPQERFTEDDRGTKTTSVGPVVYRLSAWCEELQEEYYWWTRLADRLVKVCAKTRRGCRPPVRTHALSRPVDQDRIETTWHYEGLPGGELTQWYGGDRTRVVPLTVHQHRGVSFRDAAQIQQSTQAKVTKDRCSC